MWYDVLSVKRKHKVTQCYFVIYRKTEYTVLYSAGLIMLFCSNIRFVICWDAEGYNAAVWTTEPQCLPFNSNHQLWKKTAITTVCDVLGTRDLNSRVLNIDRGSTGSGGQLTPHFFECGVNQCCLTPTFSCINRWLDHVLWRLITLSRQLTT